jgi:hypothetical protein
VCCFLKTPSSLYALSEGYGNGYQKNVDKLRVLAYYHKKQAIKAAAALRVPRKSTCGCGVAVLGTGGDTDG